MHTLPFDQPGQFYRGILHCHSTRSDGHRTPEQVVADYRARGYDFVSLTDHFLPVSRFRPQESGFITVSDTRHLATADCVTIPGAELHGPKMENGEIWHIVAVGLPLDFAEAAPEETGPELAARAAAAGAYVALAHPYWNAVSEIDALSVAGIIDAVEIYNHACEVTVRRGHGLHQAEVLLAKGHRVGFLATDDAHFKHPSGTFKDAFGGWVQVKAESLEPAVLLAALKAGHYYSSTGPEIHDICIEKGTIRITCSPVESIVITGLGALSQRAHDANLVEFEAPLPPIEKTPYVRVTVTDAFGRDAWSNPIWLDA